MGAVSFDFQERGAPENNPRRAAYVRYRAEGLSGARAAEKAGFSTPDVASSRLMQDPRIVAAIDRAALKRLMTEGVPLAVKALIDCVQPGKPDPLRIKASDAILKYARDMAPEASAGVNAMTPEERRAEIELYREFLAVAKAARPQAPEMIDVTPNAEPELYD